MTNWSIICADVLDWCENYTGEPFHAILCDPPYALNFMNKAWDNNIAFQPKTWEALAEHLLPGGFVMAFASSRGWHRLACAMEDAGLIIQPSIFGWLNGQAFPKATRIDTAIDKAAGKLEEREIIGPYSAIKGQTYKWGQQGKYGRGGNPQEMILTAPATDLARAWQGHRYGGQILKNALEPIIVAQKPWEGKRLDCIVETGAGSLWVDGGRIGLDGMEKHRTPAKSGLGKHSIYGKSTIETLEGKDLVRYTSKGRWPANFVLCHSEGCERVGVKKVKSRRDETPKADEGRQDKSQWRFRPTPQTSRGYANPNGMETVDAWQCVEGCPVAKLGEQSGISRSAGGRVGNKDGGIAVPGGRYCKGDPGYGDKGTAARFFYQSDWQHEKEELAESHTGDFWVNTSGLGSDQPVQRGDCIMEAEKSQVNWSHQVAERIVNADPVRYCPKAARAERNENLDDFYWRKDKTADIGFVRVSKEEWETLPKKERAQGNVHPTCKPISFNKWLATLLLPPKEYTLRRIAVPFAGSGSEMIATGLAGWEEIIGIEFKQDYCDIAEARLNHWLNQPTQLELV